MLQLGCGALGRVLGLDEDPTGLPRQLPTHEELQRARRFVFGRGQVRTAPPPVLQQGRRGPSFPRRQLGVLVQHRLQHREFEVVGTLIQVVLELLVVEGHREYADELTVCTSA
jgi:hypothetical protein